MNKNDLPKVTQSVGGSFGNKSSFFPPLPVTIFSIEPQSLPQLMSLPPYSKAVTGEQLNWIPSDNEMPPKAHGVRVKTFCNSLLFISSFRFPKFIATSHASQTFKHSTSLCPQCQGRMGKALLGGKSGVFQIIAQFYLENCRQKDY